MVYLNIMLKVTFNIYISLRASFFSVSVIDWFSIYLMANSKFDEVDLARYTYD